MNQTSPWLTGGATITVATLEPLVRWGLTGFAHPIPDAVPGVIAALLFTGAHAVLNWIASRNSATKQ
ncbi:hypothetical protein KDX40_04965 [Burkholderia ambifaria]|uniref:hypothetical protein n=1 Tax=Burkholderia ambifaria TaxID=152480 RepID=UPI001B937332|nr:hypothetical protein [Burkholderia ambifaria]MBR8343089.1 hypothetical protein [Burkholderia ambifaria]